MANPDAKGAPAPPPHLRMSDDESRECDSCKHLVEGVCCNCSLYSNLPVNGEWVCDSWQQGSKAEEADETDSSDEKPVPRDRQPKTLRDAKAEVRRRSSRD